MRPHNARTDRVCLVTRRAAKYVCPCRSPRWGELERPSRHVVYRVSKAYMETGDEVRSDGCHPTHTFKCERDKMYPVIPPHHPDDVTLSQPDISCELGGARWDPWWWDEGVDAWMASYTGTGVLRRLSMILWRYV